MPKLLIHTIDIVAFVLCNASQWVYLTKKAHEF